MLILAGSLVALVVQAALGQLGAMGTRPVADALVVAAGQVVHAQVGGLGTLLTGSSAGVLPLQGIGSPALSLVILLAFVGGFLTFFGSEDPDERPARRPASDTLLPFLVAVAAASVFELLAARAPSVTLLLVAAAAAASVAAIAVVARPRAVPAPASAPPAE
jgi:hypothetical protein